jgi:hypothetical protein
VVERLRNKAARYFQEGPLNFPECRPYNCYESVLLTPMGYLGIKSELVPRIATGIGAGFSLNGLTCGSISGAVIAIGIKYGRKTSRENPQTTWEKLTGS